MKVVSKPLEMISWFDTKGNIHPVKFRYEEEGQYQVVKVDKVIICDKEKLCGNYMMVFTCSSIINNQEKLYEIKYDIGGMCWFLYKI